MAAAPVNPGGHHSPEGWGLWWWWAVVILIILVIAVAFGLGGRDGGLDTGMQQENSHHGVAARAGRH